jgi:rubrerythrin
MEDISKKNQTQQKKSDPLLTEKTSPDDLDLQWMRVKCQVCGYLQEGSKVSIPCPKCGNSDPEKFVELD